MARVVLGLDIGGANLKAATADKRAVSVPFALWKQPDKLPAALAALVEQFPDATEFAVTMTGELCDCYETKRAGVNAILDAVQFAASGRPVRVWGTNNEFVSELRARNNSLEVASANWYALAQFVGRFISTEAGLLLDIGSTTSDVIPFWSSMPCVHGLTDPHRLSSGELVYTGTRRTPVCALLGGTVAAEFFATTHDAYLILEWVAEDPYNHDTADGRPATLPHAKARMSRMLCGDREVISDADIRQLAGTVLNRQLDLLQSAISRLRETLPVRGALFETVITSGSGEFLARELITRGYLHPRYVVHLSELLGEQVAACAPAYAVAVLATECHQAGEPGA